MEVVGLERVMAPHVPCVDIVLSCLPESEAVLVLANSLVGLVVLNHPLHEFELKVVQSSRGDAGEGSKRESTHFK